MSILIFDECALVILTLFIITILVRKELTERSNKILFLLLIAALLSVLGDFLGAHIGNVYAGSTRWSIIMVYLCNYLYFISHNLILPLYLLYVFSSTEMWHVYTKPGKYRCLLVIPYVVDIIVLILNVWAIDVFSVSEKGTYVRGPWLAILYIMAAIYGMWALNVLISNRKVINKDILTVLLFLYVVIVLSLLIQLINSNMLVEGFAIALSVLFYMVIARRKNSLIDHESGAFKYNEGIESVMKGLALNKSFSIVLFKIVNHANIRLYLGANAYGDFLKLVTNNIKQLSKEYQLVGQFYHMENGLFGFMVETQEEKTISAFAQSIFDSLNRTIPMGDFKIVTSADVCTVKCPEDTTEFSTILNLSTTFHEYMPDKRKVYAFSELKEIKDFGIHSEMDTIIKRALEHDGLKVDFQPIYSVADKRFTAAEALVKIRDREFGEISPGLFIPYAETDGSIHAIGDYVLDRVMRFIAEADLVSLGISYVSVNLTQSQCQAPDLVEKVSDLLEKYQVSPTSICFEIHESESANNSVLQDANIYELHQMGIRISLDGYGSGYSDVRRITRLPIDQVKLDRKLVGEVEESEMWIVVRESIKMLQELGKEILIVGIETESVARRFTELNADLLQGCNLLQGFYYCNPLTEEKFLEIIDQT